MEIKLPPSPVEHHILPEMIHPQYFSIRQSIVAYCTIYAVYV